MNIRVHGKRVLGGFLAALCVAGAVGLGGCKKKETESSEALEGNPASSTVMTSAQADSLANALSVKLYYRSTGDNLIVAETALIEFGRHDIKVSKLAGDILVKLLEGPANKASMEGIIPEGAEVKSVSLAKGTLKIDVNKAFVDGISEDADRAKLVVYSVVNTVTELKDVERVDFTCEGEAIGKLACGFEFKTFERDLSMVRSSAATIGGIGDPYAEELYENVALE